MIKNNSIPTEIRQCFKYDERTGEFERIVYHTKKGKAGVTCVEKLGYLVINFRNKKYKAHRVAWFMYYGTQPNGEIDHINHDKRDNRIANLRLVDRIVQCQNKTTPLNNTSGVQGVKFHKRLNKFEAQITVNKERKYLGIFYSFDEAVSARKQAESLYGFHRNHGNRGDV